MCGIFGIFASPAAGLDREQIRDMADRLFLLAESRGKEASGLALRDGNQLLVYKQPLAASRLIRQPEYSELFGRQAGSEQVAENGAGLYLIGHSRLVTNGMQTISVNNQPVIKNGWVAVHNGIIVNEADIWEQFPELTREFQVDTEALISMFGYFYEQGREPVSALCQVFDRIQGSASVAICGRNFNGVLLATNTGSLYLCSGKQAGFVCFLSEEYLLKCFIRDLPQWGKRLGPFTVRQVRAGSGVWVTLDGECRDFSLYNRKNQDNQAFCGNADCGTAVEAMPVVVVDCAQKEEERRRNLKRCCRCILPETIPFISFDAEGVCNFCRNYQPVVVSPREQLEAMVAPHRRSDGKPDCIVMLSGGRDSCYGLHFIKQELGLNPIAFTYDWGMITDLGRRNQARLCGKLGVEQVLISADIQRKRNFIRRNIQAWMKRPDLGMIPLFMAGDKQYYYYANKMREHMGIDLMFVCECPLELTKFKAGFCGINEGARRLFNISLLEKGKLLWYYFRQYLLNPAYFNMSLVDTLFAYAAAYLINHDYVFLYYNYERWDERKIVDTLIQEYDWETAPDTQSTWRIGDGTAAFYNYIYYTVAGFTENDTLRSNQIREGMLNRDEALKLVAMENQPRWESMQWYANTVGFDLNEALNVIHSMPKIFA